jgi:hypothetical protein
MGLKVYSRGLTAIVFGPKREREGPLSYQEFSEECER